MATSKRTLEALDRGKAAEAEATMLRQALTYCDAQAAAIMASQGYSEDNNGDWLGPRLHAIRDMARRALSVPVSR